jgi:hypothetical protein
MIETFCSCLEHHGYDSRYGELRCTGHSTGYSPMLSEVFVEHPRSRCSVRRPVPFMLRKVTMQPV